MVPDGVKSSNSKVYTLKFTPPESATSFELMLNVYPVKSKGLGGALAIAYVKTQSVTSAPPVSITVNISEIEL